MLVVEQAVREGLRKLRLAHARGAEEEKAADGAVRVRDAGARALDGLGHEADGLVLPDHALMDDLVEAQQLFALALHQTADGDARPLADDVGDLVLGHGVMHHGVVAIVLLGRSLGVLELLFKRGQIRILELRGFLVLEIGLRPLDVAVHLLDLALELLDALHTVLLRLPAGLHGVELFLLVGKLLLQFLQTVAGELVVLLLEGHFLDLLLHDLAAQIVQLGGHGVDLRADHRAGLIHEVDGLVGQETVGDIARGQRRGGDERIVVDAHAVVNFITLLESAQDGDGVLHRRLIDLYWLEAALERGILFDVLAVLVERGRADAVQLAAGEQRLQKIACVHAALGLARADDGVQLVDEEDDLPLGLLDLVQNGLQAFLELATVLRTRDERAHVEREDGAVLQPLGHVAAHDTLGKALGDGGLADARLADEHRVVLGFTRQDADDVADLRVAADDGVKLLAAGALDKVGAVLFQRVVGLLGIVRGHGSGFDLAQLVGKAAARDAVALEQLLDVARSLGEDSEHQVLDGDIIVVQLLSGLFGKVQNFAGLR